MTLTSSYNYLLSFCQSSAGLLFLYFIFYIPSFPIEASFIPLNVYIFLQLSSLSSTFTTLINKWLVCDLIQSFPSLAPLKRMLFASNYLSRKTFLLEAFIQLVTYPSVHWWNIFWNSCRPAGPGLFEFGIFLLFYSIFSTVILRIWSPLKSVSSSPNHFAFSLYPIVPFHCTPLIPWVLLNPPNTDPPTHRSLITEPPTTDQPITDHITTNTRTHWSSTHQPAKAIIIFKRLGKWRIFILQNTWDLGKILPVGWITYGT